MRKGLFLLISMTGLALSVSAQTPAEILDKGDHYFWAVEDYAEGYDYLMANQDKMVTDEDKAAMNWRIARARLSMADMGEDRGMSKQDRLTYYEEAWAWADKSIELTPEDATSWYWRGCSMGRWGQTYGIFQALQKANMMVETCDKSVRLDENSSDAWGLMRQVYNQAPSFLPIGNKDYSVSLTRKAMATWVPVDSYAPELNSFYVTKLAQHLYDRDYSARYRNKYIASKQENFKTVEDVVEKNFNYEGSLDWNSTPVWADKPYSEMSDYDEAIAILKWFLKEAPNAPQYPVIKRHIAKVERWLEEWT